MKRTSELSLARKHRISAININYSISRYRRNELTNSVLRMGFFLNNLKSRCKEEGVIWRDIITKHFPHIQPRQIRRFMELARYVNIFNCPNFSHLTLSQIKKLISLSGNQNVEKFLIRNGIEVYFENNHASISIFKKNVQHFINIQSLNNNKCSLAKSNMRCARDLFFSTAKLTTELKVEQKKLSYREISNYKKLIKRLKSLIEIYY